jgi:hypothetical protein
LITLAAAPLGVILAGAAMAAGTTADASRGTVPYQSRDKDEDPFALLGPDGTAYVFWFSNRLRDGELHSDIVYTTYKGGKFGAFHDISGDTSGAERDVYPTAVLDPDGVIHVSWFRFLDGSVPGTQFPLSSIMYRTIHTATGELGPLEDVSGVSSANPHADWVPTIALDGGAPVIAFASPTRGAKPNTWTIVWTRRSARGWTRPTQIKGANAARTQNNLPALANVGDGLALAWNRHPPRGSLLAWEHMDTEIWMMRYRGGRWGRASRAAPNPSKLAPNVFPSFLEDHSDRWLLYWQHHEAGKDSLQAIPVEKRSSAPSTLPMRLAGYSPRITRLPGAAQYLGLWVKKGRKETDLDIAYQRFRWRG